MNKETGKIEAGDKQPKVVFENAETYGDQIRALVDKYTGASISDFVLEKALKQVKANNKLIDKYVQDVKDGSIKPISQED